MTRMVIGLLLAIWGTAAAVYGLTRPIDTDPFGAGQIAALVLAACLALGGIALAGQGIARAGGPSAGRVRPPLVWRECVRDWEPDWGGDLSRRRKQTGPDVSPRIIALVFGVVLVLAAFVVCAVLIARKDQRKLDAEQASANRPTDENTRQPADVVPRPAPNQPQPQPPPFVPPPFVPPPFVPPAPMPEPSAAPALKSGLRETIPAGGAFANNAYREYRPEGSVLTGFEVGYGKVFNTVIIAYLRPIWLTAKGEQYGIAYGRSQTPTVIVKARDGYAVGGIVIAGGGALEGFALTYMRIGEKHLVADDAYTSDWYGEPTRKPRPEGMTAGDGPFVVGLFGKRFDDKRGNNFDNGGAIATIGFVLWVKE